MKNMDKGFRAVDCVRDAQKQLDKIIENISIDERLKSVVDDIKGVKSTLDYADTNMYEFVVDNEPTPKKAFNIRDYVASDKLRPVMEGVFHDPEHKMAVATDAHILMADAESFDENLVHKQIIEATKDRPEQVWFNATDKYGKPIEGRYPNWYAVIPKDVENFKEYTVNIDEVIEANKRANAYMKLNYEVSGFPVFNVPDTNVYLKCDYFIKFLRASGGKLLAHNGSRCIFYKTDNRICLLMPVLCDKNEPKSCYTGDGFLISIH